MHTFSGDFLIYTSVSLCMCENKQKKTVRRVGMFKYDMEVVSVMVCVVFCTGHFEDLRLDVLFAGFMSVVVA